MNGLVGGSVREERLVDPHLDDSDKSQPAIGGLPQHLDRINSIGAAGFG